MARPYTRVPDVCGEPGCDKPGYSNDRCQMHVIRWRRANWLLHPRFAHDCKSCIYLGSKVFSYDNGVIRRHTDLYFCPTEINLVARYGDLGDYASGMEFVLRSRELRYAYDLAQGSDKLTDSQKRRLRRHAEFILADNLSTQVRCLQFDQLERLAKFLKEEEKVHDA